MNESKSETEVAKCIICEHISYAISEDEATKSLIQMKDYCLTGQTIEVLIQNQNTGTGLKLNSLLKQVCLEPPDASSSEHS